MLYSTCFCFFKIKGNKITEFNHKMTAVAIGESRFSSSSQLTNVFPCLRGPLNVPGTMGIIQKKHRVLTL